MRASLSREPRALFALRARTALFQTRGLLSRRPLTPLPYNSLFPYPLCILSIRFFFNCAAHYSGRSGGFLAKSSTCLAASATAPGGAISCDCSLSPRSPPLHTTTRLINRATTLRHRATTYAFLFGRCRRAERSPRMFAGHVMAAGRWIRDHTPGLLNKMKPKLNFLTLHCKFAGQKPVVESGLLTKCRYISGGHDPDWVCDHVRRTEYGLYRCALLRERRRHAEWA